MANSLLPRVRRGGEKGLGLLGGLLSSEGKVSYHGLKPRARENMLFMQRLRFLKYLEIRPGRALYGIWGGGGGGTFGFAFVLLCFLF